jgi:hypothetical protein
VIYLAPVYFNFWPVAGEFYKCMQLHFVIQNICWFFILSEMLYAEGPSHSDAPSPNKPSASIPSIDLLLARAPPHTLLLLLLFRVLLLRRPICCSYHCSCSYFARPPRCS